jgi:tetratricopeptide (TPR) repeat protein
VTESTEGGNGAAGDSSAGRCGQDLGRALAAGPRGRQVAMLKGHLRRLVGHDGHPWLAECARIAHTYALTIPEIRDIVSDLAWFSRVAGEPFPDEHMSPPHGLDANMYRLVEVYALGQRLRFDFLFRKLHDRCRAWLDEFDDALILSFAAMASLALRYPDGVDLYAKAVSASDADKRSRHAALMGMWIGQHVEDQAELMLRLCAQMISEGQDDSTLYFRRSRAFARQRKYEAALDDIYRAMEMLGPDQNDIHQDYVRELQIIGSRIEAERSVRIPRHNA